MADPTISNEDFINNTTALYQYILSNTQKYGGMASLGIIRIANSTSEQAKQLRDDICSKIQVIDYSASLGLIQDISQVTSNVFTEGLFDSLDYKNEIEILNNAIGPVVNNMKDFSDQISQYFNQDNLPEDKMTFINDNLTKITEQASDAVSQAVTSFSGVVDNYKTNNDDIYDYSNHQLSRSHTKLLELSKAFISSMKDDPMQALKSYTSYLRNRAKRITNSKMMKIVGLLSQKVDSLISGFGHLVCSGAEYLTKFVGTIANSMLGGLFSLGTFVDEIYNLLHQSELLLSKTYIPLANVPTFSPDSTFLSNYDNIVKKAEITFDSIVESLVNNKYNIQIKPK